MTRITHGQGFLDWLSLAGIIPEKTQRVVIDASYDGPVKIYVEMFGSKEMLDVEPPPELRTRIKVVTKE